MSTAVIGAPEFRARSGRKVQIRDNGTVTFDHANGYLSPETAMDADEFFQAQRDLELGRWRCPTETDWVAREGERTDDGRTVVVVNERTLDRFWFNERVRDAAADVDVAHRVGRAYFEAHPQTKLPTENGVYVPATADLEGGPLTFVLYEGSWRATPGGDDATELARQWHARNGLVRLGKIEDAS